MIKTPLHQLAENLVDDYPLFRATGDGFRLELRADKSTPGNLKAVLLVFDCSKPDAPAVAEIMLGEPTSLCVWLRCFDLEHTLGIKPGSRKFMAKVRAIRKGLGYSYP